MDKKRRKFLKIAGLSTIAGLGAPAVFNQLVKGELPGLANASAPQHGAEPQPGGGHVEAAPTGIRLGMVIDQRVFAANKGLGQKCIDACHLTHNVPDFQNPKDEIKWIWETGYENAFPTASHNLVSDKIHAQKFLVLCNHCDNPPCVRVCPTKATFKADDGKVIMDFHRCIGCRFCMAACPYGARSFNWRDPRGKDEKGRPFIDRATYNKDFPTRMRGVVEKCNFCAERLGQGKDPACVEAAAGTNGIIYGDLNDPHSTIRKVLASNYTIQRKAATGTKPSIFYIV
jgi:molybdopterin-containing oxidoreductase family iron-sulfur binding subunit